MGEVLTVGQLAEGEADQYLGQGYDYQADDRIKNRVFGRGDTSIVAAAGDIAEAADNYHDDCHYAHDSR